jgi:5'-3' exonuclease
VPRPLLVVDAPSMLFRAFYALPRSIKGPDGKPVNALLGTANLILREVEAHDPRAVVLCFGPDAAAYRLELYPAYHADREAAFPDELGPQWEDSAEFFGAFGWTVAASEDMEADDLLHSFAEKEANAGGRSLLMTGDRDMFQCASGQTKVLYVSTGKQGGQPMGPAEVKQRYGIPPRLVPDLIALRGDPSDNIPGARGIGQKTAAELLRRYGDLEGVIAHAGELTPRQRDAVAGSADELRGYLEVATMRPDLPIAIPDDAELDLESASAWCTEAGMLRLAARLAG